MKAFVIQYVSALCILIVGIGGVIGCASNSKFFVDEYNDGKIISTEYNKEYNFTKVVYSGIDKDGDQKEFESNIRTQKQSYIKESTIGDGTFYETSVPHVFIFVAVLTILGLILWMSTEQYDRYRTSGSSKDIQDINKLKVRLWEKYKIFCGAPQREIKEFCGSFIYPRNKILTYGKIQETYMKSCTVD